MGSGAYGYSVEGISAGAGLVVDVPDGWPPITLRQTTEPPAGEATRLIGGGHLTIGERSATIHRAEPLSDDALVHPYLAPVAARFAVAEGAVPFHAGAYVSGDATWLVVGPRQAGKSSLMASLAARGLDVVADDLTVVRDGVVMAGPRTLDLRADVAERHEGTRFVEDAGQRERWRLDLGPIAPELPAIAGVFRLGWADDVGVETVSEAAERMRMLLGALSNSSEINVPAVMALAIGAAYDIVRPQSWDATDAVIDAMLGVHG